MLKIEFWLKKPDTDQESLEFITIGVPKVGKVAKTSRRNYYVCEVYSSSSKEKIYPIYGVNPIDTVCLASEFTRTYLQGLIKRGYAISEVESKKPWSLEKLSDNYLQEKINTIKNNKEISPEDKQKIFKILKESFGNSPIKEQLNKILEENDT